MSVNKIRSENKLSSREAVICLILFIVAGFGFVVMHVSDVDVIDKSQAKELTATFENYDYFSSRSRYINYIDLEFSDAETMRIDSSIASWELIDSIGSIEKGTEIYMLIDESRNYVMELRIKDEVIINFEDAQYNMKSDKTGLAVLGIIMIIGGIFMFFYIDRKEKNVLKGRNK